MHILALNEGAIDTGDEAVDLDQSPADIVVLSSAETELSALARAYRDWPRNFDTQPGAQPPSLRLANTLSLRHNYSVDLYLEKTLARARLIVVRALGGRSYWPYGLEQIAALANRADGTPPPRIAIVPGDANPDASLDGLSNIAEPALYAIWQCLNQGGPENTRLFLSVADALCRNVPLPEEAPQAIAKAGTIATPHRARDANAPRAAIIVYRALYLSGDLAPVDALCKALSDHGIQPAPLYVTSLRDPDVARFLAAQFANAPPDVVINATAFASGAVETTMQGDAAGPDQSRTHAFGSNAPWLQVVLSSQSQEAWRENSAGLTTRDIAMHVALPEFDGRILSRAIAFRGNAGRDPLTEHFLTELQPLAERVDFVARLARAWARLRHSNPADRKIAVILPNYPNRDSRLANGVGLNTPASTVDLLKNLAQNGYKVSPPASSNDLMASLRAGPTNAPNKAERTGSVTLALPEYDRHFAQLPLAVQTAVTDRWGLRERDPFVAENVFVLPLHRTGNVVVGIQPARGYNIDPQATYHDPGLVPPHGYFATYFWLREVFGAHAFLHIGKHGNLEWLPGKALALSEDCFPDAVLGPAVNIYPFIVNDPGEGAQAKRRTGAVIVDHLTPPLTRAETYGTLRDIETMLDEYYDALTLDPPRATRLAAKLIDRAEATGFASDCGFSQSAPQSEKLQRLDAYLCELKELQIRGGLHVLGSSPAGTERRDLLAALVRVPRNESPAGQSLQRAIALDLGLEGFDPLACDFSAPWTGPRPSPLKNPGSDPWRTAGDTVERIELLAAGLIDGSLAAPLDWHHTCAVIDDIRTAIAPALDASGERETAAVLTALDGRLVAPGPSGAPTRGRLDVLPTGRNFYSLDSRTLPTRTAWELGRKSADALIQRYIHDNGDWPRAIALSAWGTANMRTGGDDLAQALALMGVAPRWEKASGRVTGFEVIPLARLGRPRVDVTLRISGFFRDAFPQQIALIDSAVRAIAELDEDATDNPLAAKVREETAARTKAGLSPDAAKRTATFRIFGAKPGAYGAGLQAMFDENIWTDDTDLAEAFLIWGAHAYGSDTSGAPSRDALESRLRAVDAIVHNQDNREHDILDSDDYYQFAGGLAVASRVLKGTPVPVYHGDHARPERPVIRALDEEIARIVRARAVNPKWISAMMRHGYKGAFEMAATVDYLFAFAVTANAVRDHHFDAIYDAYIDDPAVRAFIEDKNPDALADIAARLKEAIDRNIWQPKRNSAHPTLTALASAQSHAGS